MQPAYLLPKPPPPPPLHAMIRSAGHMTLDQSKFSDAPAARWFLVYPKTYNFSQRLRRAAVSGDIMHLINDKSVLNPSVSYWQGNARNRACDLLRVPYRYAGPSLAGKCGKIRICDLL